MKTLQALGITIGLLVLLPPAGILVGNIIGRLANIVSFGWVSRHLIADTSDNLDRFIEWGLVGLLLGAGIFSLCFLVFLVREVLIS